MNELTQAGIVTGMVRRGASAARSSPQLGVLPPGIAVAGAAVLPARLRFA